MRNIKSLPLRPSIEHKGQPYVDEPVYAFPKEVSPLERALASAFRRPLPQAMQVGTERVRLCWMKPDGRGGLVPR